MNENLKIRILSSAEKCFWDERPEDKPEYLSASALKGETFSLELAISGDGATRLHYLSVRSPLKDRIRLFAIEDAPVKSPKPDMPMEGYVRDDPGLYPDVLRPLSENGEIWLRNRILCSYWVDVTLDESVAAGTYPIEFVLTGEQGEEEYVTAFSLTVLNAVLPPEKLTYAHWIHYDCLADAYEVKVFSERHWKIMRNYLTCARKNGVTAAFTPLFTPPLDTMVGHERPTVQLVDVTVENGEYRFGYKKFRRFVRMCRSIGFTQFEFSHLFTQWGARHAPKIVATENGVCRKIFGWETSATSEEYVGFLRAFLTDFKQELLALKLSDKCFFHISDEPNEETLESYTAAKNAIADLLADYPVMDALSHFDLYSKGAVKNPIVAIDSFTPFLEAKVSGLWGYHCIAQWRNVSNRFISMTMSRTRVIGAQLYKFNVEGFLQWGYNFWYSMLSTQKVNPYLTPSGGFFTFDGDTCGVYPGPNGMPIESMHMRAFTQALTDLRAMQLCEALCGREAVLEAIDGGLESPITFTSYPYDEHYAQRVRERVNATIAAALA